VTDFLSSAGVTKDYHELFINLLEKCAILCPFNSSISILKEKNERKTIGNTCDKKKREKIPDQAKFL
jgi:hypothetical protein